jgi:hypothetical protein
MSRYEKILDNWDKYFRTKLGINQNEFETYHHQLNQGIFLENQSPKYNKNGNVLDNSLFVEYQKLILQLEDYIDLTLKSRLKDRTVSWLIYKSENKKKIENANFDLDKLFKNWVDNNKYDLPINVERAYYEQLKNTKYGKLLVKSIEMFHNYKSNPSCYKLVDKTIYKENSFSFLFRAKDQSISSTSRNNERDSKRSAVIEFIDQSNELLELRFNHHFSEVKGNLKGVSYQKMDYNKWCNEDLMDLIIRKEQVSIGEYLPKNITIDEVLVNRFKKKEIVVCESLDLEMTLDSELNDLDYKNLIENEALVFPFYIPRELISNISIKKNEINSEVRIKISCNQPIVIGRF